MHAGNGVLDGKIGNIFQRHGSRSHLMASKVVKVHCHQRYQTLLLRSCKASSNTNHDTTVTKCRIPVYYVLNLSTALSVVPDFSGDARNMVGQSTMCLGCTCLRLMLAIGK